MQYNLPGTEATWHVIIRGAVVSGAQGKQHREKAGAGWLCPVLHANSTKGSFCIGNTPGCGLGATAMAGVCKRLSSGCQSAPAKEAVPRLRCAEPVAPADSWPGLTPQPVSLLMARTTEPPAKVAGVIKMDCCQDNRPRQSHLWMLGSQGTWRFRGPGRQRRKRERGGDHKITNQALLLGRQQPPMLSCRH